MAESPAKPWRSRAYPDFRRYSIRMYYVYLLRSKNNAAHRDIGFTEDLRTRIADHNEGKNPSTAPYRP
jgi:hypothetical protein